MVVAELCALPSATSPIDPGRHAVVGVAGFVAGFARLRAARPDWWPIAASVAAYLVAVGPVLLAWRVTVSGYLLDTTVAFHLAGSDYLIEHGRDFARVPDSALHGMLVNYFGAQYPSGGHTLLGGAGRLVGTDAHLALPAVHVAAARLLHADPLRPRPAARRCRGRRRRSGRCSPRRRRSSTRTRRWARSRSSPRCRSCSCSARSSPCSRSCSSAVRAGRWSRPWWAPPASARSASPSCPGSGRRRSPASSCCSSVRGATSAAFDRSPAGSPCWRSRWSSLAIPTFGPLGESTALAGSFNASIADPGNLLRPLLDEQMFGIWIGGSHRGDPTEIAATYVLIGVAALAALLGAGYLVRRRHLEPGGVRGGDGRGLGGAHPAGGGLDGREAAGDHLTDPSCSSSWAWRACGAPGGAWRRVLVGTAVAVGILVSNAFTYHDTNLQPTDRYNELLKIGQRFAGLTPTLTPSSTSSTSTPSPTWRRTARATRSAPSRSHG